MAKAQFLPKALGMVGSGVKPPLATIRHEVGNLTEYTTTVTNGGRLTAAEAAALASSVYGMNCLIENTTVMYGAKTVTAVPGKARVRFYLDPNTLTMAANAEIGLLTIRNTATLSAGGIYLNYSGGYRLRAFLIDDSGSQRYTSSFTITDGPHYVEIYWQRATDAVAANGLVTLWIDGALQGSSSPFDNYDRFDVLAAVRLGIVEFKTGTPTGTVFLDEMVINDTGNEIGAYPFDFRFLWFSDSHIGDPAWGAGEFDNLVTNMNSREADFVIATGDVCGAQLGDYATQEDVDLYNASAANFAMPHYEISGNHDPLWFPHFVIDNQDVRVIGLISESVPEGDVTDEELVWLEAQLRESSGRRIIIACHFPLSNVFDPDRCIQKNRDEIIALCNQYNVRLFLSGHLHGNCQTDVVGNVTLNVNGGAISAPNEPFTRWMLCDVFPGYAEIKPYSSLSPYERTSVAVVTATF